MLDNLNDGVWLANTLCLPNLRLHLVCKTEECAISI